MDIALILVGCVAAIAAVALVIRSNRSSEFGTVKRILDPDMGPNPTPEEKKVLVKVYRATWAVTLTSLLLLAVSLLEQEIWFGVCFLLMAGISLYLADVRCPRCHEGGRFAWSFFILTRRCRICGLQLHEAPSAARAQGSHESLDSASGRNGSPRD